jgi:hypothetical protein
LNGVAYEVLQLRPIQVAWHDPALVEATERCRITDLIR